MDAHIYFVEFWSGETFQTKEKTYTFDKQIILDHEITEHEVEEMCDDVAYHTKAHQYNLSIFAVVYKAEIVKFD